MPAVYDDYTGLDYHYNQDEAEKRMKEIQNGISELSDVGNIVLTNEELEFSNSSCSCCKSKLAGKRFEIELI
jgi:hypothetical protein